MQRDSKNILIIQPATAKDIVDAFPALIVLREKFPKAKISWLVQPEFKSLLDNNSGVDEIIIFDRRFMGKAWYNPNALMCLLFLIKQLRKDKYDYVIDFQNLYRTASIAWLTGCKRIFGMGNAREFASIFYTHRFFQTKAISKTDFYVKVANGVISSSFTPTSVLSKEKAFKKPEKWLIDFSYFIPRRGREPIIGDILEDCHELRKHGKSESRIWAQIVWQLIVAIYEGWLRVISKGIIRLLIVIRILSIK